MEGGTYWQVATASAISCERAHVDPLDFAALRSRKTTLKYIQINARSQFLSEPKEESQSTKEDSTSAPLGDQSSLGESTEPANEFASTEGSKKSRTSRMSA